ncbi:hypothetical protein NE619_16965 [Anaerovorax odorimutans]|uniref:Lipoprotein n=1 Tax=Anaerovorax odorimutans TaxID=109327 RepID=A0ABT1RTH6_9FIRM|nr:hypothetical protein [Anaerovorax odorimutans]MCQ4638424.1 hypothetical protein [Anaerovorax odorimutans]
MKNLQISQKHIVFVLLSVILFAATATATFSYATENTAAMTENTKDHSVQYYKDGVQISEQEYKAETAKDAVSFSDASLKPETSDPIIGEAYAILPMKVETTETGKATKAAAAENVRINSYATYSKTNGVVVHSKLYIASGRKALKTMSGKLKFTVRGQAFYNGSYKVSKTSYVSALTNTKNTKVKGDPGFSFYIKDSGTGTGKNLVGKNYSIEYFCKIPK